MLDQFKLEDLMDELRVREANREKVSANGAEKDAASKDMLADELQELSAAVIHKGYMADPQVQSELNQVETADLVEAIQFRQKVVYGTDDRQDLYEVLARDIQLDADSVVALIESRKISSNGDGTSTLQGPSLGAQSNLCASEPFRDQPSVARCSGFLVDPSFIATAGHCVNEGNLASQRFVFGYEMENASTANTNISDSQIYRGIRIVGRRLESGEDWAIVQLDRPVLDHRPVRVRRQGKVADNAAVHVIGHPSGLPKKYAPGANVRENDNSDYFVANLDTYGGNSGSPVFNSLTHTVEGILVRGETDYVTSGSCRVSNVCPANGCRGEDCMRTTEFDHLIPQTRTDFIPFNPDRAVVRRIRNRWKIVVGNMLLLDFGSNRSEANRTLQIIHHYGFNSQCFVGRPQPSMEFYLVDGEAPSGPFPGEDSIPFDPNALEVQRINGRWKIVEGNHWLMDFGNSQSEARQSLSFILRYGFRYSCYVGRPGPSLRYFRR
ncbi:MAG: serine protease [Cyanobacteria bacterium P01_B01_bin.77]